MLQQPKEIKDKVIIINFNNFLTQKKISTKKNIEKEKSPQKKYWKRK